MWTTMTVRDGMPGGRCGAAARRGGFELRTLLEESEARELNAVVGILEALAVSLAPPFDAATIAELREANVRLRKLAGVAGSASAPRGASAGADATTPNAAAVAVADHDFHRRLADPCGDEQLLTTLAPVRRSIYHLAVSATPTAADVQRAAADHDAVVDALVAGDHAAAAQLLREHIAAGLSELLAAGEPGDAAGAGCGPAPGSP